MQQIDAKTLNAVRNTRPTDAQGLWRWIWLTTGVKLSTCKVCRNHQAPFEFIAHSFLHRPNFCLCLGARGSGKSFMAGIDTHLDSRFFPRHSTLILGGSEAQSRQIYNAIDESVVSGRGPEPFNLTDADTISHFGKEISTYKNGSDVRILAASQKNARGPHVPCLRLDEVDEIEPEIRDSALGMCMAKHGYAAKLTLTSTWHNLGGPMSDMIDKAREDNWPFFSFCSFEVLERCPESRSGKWVGGEAGYENCPQCPLKQWCHAERDLNGDRPLAKISDGHYSIDAMIQKTAMVSRRTFEADYLCLGPKADGVWFTNFDGSVRSQHITTDAEYRPGLDVHLAVDTGVRTGAVYFQVEYKHDWRTGRRDALVNVFADYYAEGLVPDQIVNGFVDEKGEHVDGLKEIAGRFCEGRMDKRWTDPAGKARNASGTVVIGQYQEAGLGMSAWPKVSVVDALSLVESLLMTADGRIRLRVHPRCKHTINALLTYKRAKVGGVYRDYPADPQHPAENLVDPLKNGLVAVLGVDGLAPSATHARVNVRQIF